jgi:hypothetical protein
MAEKISFEMALNKAAQLPLVHIGREDFLKKHFSKRVESNQLQAILDMGAPAAGVHISIIDEVAKGCINHETTTVSTISTAAGIPGGFAIIGTIPADIVQFYGHVLRIAQKLAYLYGWPDMFKEMDDGTINLLTLFIGVMCGVQAATAAVARIAAQLSNNVPKQLIKQALTKGTIYPIVKSVAKRLGIKMTKEIFAKSVGKIIPVVGGVVSGGLTIATFRPMTNKLRKHLSSIVGDPGIYKSVEVLSI